MENTKYYCCRLVCTVADHEHPGAHVGRQHGKCAFGSGCGRQPARQPASQPACNWAANRPVRHPPRSGGRQAARCK
eukprot:6225433-Heterocapsa_arctica.AAC.1